MVILQPIAILIESFRSAALFYRQPMLLRPFRHAPTQIGSLQPYLKSHRSGSDMHNIELSRPADLREAAPVLRTPGVPSTRPLRGRLQRFVIHPHYSYLFIGTPLR